MIRSDFSPEIENRFSGCSSRSSAISIPDLSLQTSANGKSQIHKAHDDSELALRSSHNSKLGIKNDFMKNRSSKSCEFIDYEPQPSRDHRGDSGNISILRRSTVFREHKKQNKCNKLSFTNPKVSFKTSGSHDSTISTVILGKLTSRERSHHQKEHNSEQHQQGTFYRIKQHHKRHKTSTTSRSRHTRGQLDRKISFNTRMQQFTAYSEMVKDLMEEIEITKNELTNAYNKIDELNRQMAQTSSQNETLQWTILDSQTKLVKQNNHFKAKIHILKEWLMQQGNLCDCCESRVRVLAKNDMGYNYNMQNVGTQTGFGCKEESTSKKTDKPVSTSIETRKQKKIKNTKRQKSESRSTAASIHSHSSFRSHLDNDDEYKAGFLSQVCEAANESASTIVMLDNLSQAGSNENLKARTSAETQNRTHSHSQASLSRITTETNIKHSSCEPPVIMPKFDSKYELSRNKSILRSKENCVFQNLKHSKGRTESEIKLRKKKKSGKFKKWFKNCFSRNDSM